jgi:voltage-dependent anion channel protein 2
LIQPPAGYVDIRPLLISNSHFIFSPAQIMSPPAYSDLGKNARDIFGKGYHFGLWKLDLKTKTDSGVEFTTAGHSNQEDGKVFGSLETKYKVKEYGLTFSEKWSTNNTLSSEVAIENQLVKGLKLSFDGSFAPQTG